MRRDFPCLNSTVIEAYAAEPSREQLEKVRHATREAGAEFDLRVMAAHGGTISIEACQLARTLISGPIGGVIGACCISWRSSARGDAMSCAPTSAVPESTSRSSPTATSRSARSPTSRFLLNLPLVQVDSIGAGTGPFVRIDLNSGRPELGPDLAGARIGVCWAEGGLRRMTVTHLNLVLGRINPEYFLGGEIGSIPNAPAPPWSSRSPLQLGLTPEQAAAG